MDAMETFLPWESGSDGGRRQRERRRGGGLHHVAAVGVLRAGVQRTAGREVWEDVAGGRCGRWRAGAGFAADAARELDSRRLRHAGVRRTAGREVREAVGGIFAGACR
jgi:hypothetical protein